MKVFSKEKDIVNKIKKYLISKYSDNIKSIILYGSRARGEAREDSDIDVLVVVDDSVDPREVRESLSDILLDILLDDGELVSVLVVKEGLFENYRSPFFINVKREGIRV